MVRVLKFLEPIRDSLLKIKSKLNEEPKWEYSFFSYQNLEAAQKQLNSAGKDGWELVSTSFDSNKDKTTYWVKRRIRD